MFIGLIPKIPRAIDYKDLRPISFVSGICKIIAKNLTNKLKMVLEKIIYKLHNAFICSTQILDHVLIAN